MKTTYGKMLVLVMATIMLLAMPLPCRAVDKEKEKIWSEDEPRRLHRRFELTEERIERIMNQLKETNAEKAEELSQLREKEPEKFKAELRKLMRERFGRRFRERGKERSERRGRRPGVGGPPGFGPPGYGGPGMPEITAMLGKGMHRRYGELLEWLEKHHPEEAERLRDMQAGEPGLFLRQMGLGLKKYGRILEAARENPELAEVLKQDLELKQQRDELLREIETASDDERQELIGELEEVISSRFDLIVKRKQIEYEQLLDKLERLKKRVEESEAKVDKWKDAEFKKESVKARLEELVGETGEFKW